ncbi:hypothetical protein P7K49_019705 [Saguinus oedipus]|uniref:Uncharacterized protein n=1 Tax=Saguinus oedipus TaxID=9490 RepID=A0ABQ9UZX4_SAGOE|nr:hypothetical protein P7K49_019705 [Saguinus oedipus]
MLPAGGTTTPDASCCFRKRMGLSAVSFSKDLKTLADGLIQEPTKYDLGCPVRELLGGRVELQECSEEIPSSEGRKEEAQGSEGKTVVVRLCDSQVETSVILSLVLGQNHIAAEILAKGAYKQDMSLDRAPGLDGLELLILPTHQLDIWINSVVNGGTGW